MWLLEEFIMPSSSSRIAIVGSGAIGGFYRLIPARAGFEVNSLPRSEHQAVAKNAHAGRGLLMIGETPYE
jgi:ketopantoate reductase